MQHIKQLDAQTNEYNDGTVTVTEFLFPDNDTINDAAITIRGRYPEAGFAVNNISTALVSVEAGSGTLTIKDTKPHPLEVGERLLIKPGEPYCFEVTKELTIRYIATPAWTPEQAHTID